VITLRNVHKTYGRVPALQGVDLNVEPNEILAVTGPSGSGKTTLLRLVAGLEPVDEGEILFGDVTVSTKRRTLPPHKRHIGLAMQHPALWPHLSVLEHLEFVLGAQAPEEAREHITALLAASGLGDLAGRRAAELSGGEGRRLSIARALAARPAILLLDEPFVHLDPELRASMIRLVARTAREASMTVVLVSHRLEDVEEIADRMVRLQSGRIAPALEQATLSRWNGDE